MSELKSRFEELAGESAPPSRLSAGGVYAKAFRRRRQRAGWLAGTGVAVLLVAGTGLSAVRAPADLPAAEGPRPAPSAGGWPADSDGTVISAAATDAEHLYAGVNACGTRDGDWRCTTRLVGSDDGGRTWTVRQAEFGDGVVTSPVPGVLLRTVEMIDGPQVRGAKVHFVHWLSVDGGRGWREVRAAEEPVTRVPAGGWVQCAHGEHCTLLAFDPATARSAPLASQPRLRVDAVAPLPTSAGLWVTGRAADDDFRPAVAVSHDRGRSWTEHVFETGSPSLGSAVPYSIDGVTAYTVVSAEGPLVFRSADGGRTWQRVDADRSLPAGPGTYEEGDAYLAADGTHVVLTEENAPQRWYASRDGGRTYRPAGLTGLGTGLDQSAPQPTVMLTAPGVYLAFDDTTIYRSTDGINWSATAPARWAQGS